MSDRRGFLAFQIFRRLFLHPENRLWRSAPLSGHANDALPIASRRVRAALRDALHHLRLGLQLLELPPRVVGVKARDVR